MSNTGRFCVLFDVVAGRRAAQEFRVGFAAFVDKHPILHNLGLYRINFYGQDDNRVVTGDCEDLRPEHVLEYFGGKPPAGVTVYIINSTYDDCWEKVQ